MGSMSLFVRERVPNSIKPQMEWTPVLSHPSISSRPVRLRAVERILQHADAVGVLGQVRVELALCGQAG